MALFGAVIRGDSVFPFSATSKSSCVRFRLFFAWNVHAVVFLPIFVFWIFTTRTYVRHHGLFFLQFGIFLYVALRELCCFFFAFGSSSSLCNPFSMLFIQLAFPLWFLRFHINSKTVLLPSHPVAGKSSFIFPRVTGRIFFVVLESPVLFVLFDLLLGSF